jgi:hypothetical protein
MPPRAHKRHSGLSLCLAELLETQRSGLIALSRRGLGSR